MAARVFCLTRTAAGPRSDVEIDDPQLYRTLAGDAYNPNTNYFQRTSRLPLFFLRLVRLIGREDYDGAIDLLRAHLKGNASDQPSLELIALAHYFADRADQAIAAGEEALAYDSASFQMHMLLALWLAEKDEHAEAARHARQALENDPEPIPEPPRFLINAIKCLGRIFPRLRRVDPDAALQRLEAQHAEWRDWAERYLDWYDLTYG